MLHAIVIHPKDNVAVAIEPLKAGMAATFRLKDGPEQSLTPQEDVGIYHKLAICPIQKGAAVIKYGEVIGYASADIPVGAHVHTHDVLSHEEMEGKR